MRLKMCSCNDHQSPFKGTILLIEDENENDVREALKDLLQTEELNVVATRVCASYCCICSRRLMAHCGPHYTAACKVSFLGVNGQKSIEGRVGQLGSD
jgi:hypothetical protein